MLASIIKEGKNNYYVNLREKGTTKIISVIRANNNETRSLRKEEALELLKRILSTKLTFKEKVDGYDVYTDEVDNKRYFKDGKEDYVLFFKNNGISAIEYDYSSLGEKHNHDEKVKKFRFNTGMILITSTNLLLINTIIANYINPVYPNDPIAVVYDQAAYNDVDMITESEIESLIMDSTSMKPSDKEKIINKDLFNDVLYYADESRNYELRKKFENIQIKFYNDYEGNTTLGYYSATDPNTIHLLSILNNYDDTMYHELIHVLQDNNDYSYIREASAELISKEYFDDAEISAYRDEVRNLKLLIETVGPKPIMECNFKGDVTSFEDAIKKNLSEDEAKRLLDLFKTSYKEFTKDPITRDEINNEIENLIVKLYYNKYGENLTDMDNSSYMRYLYINGDSGFNERTYLNEHKDDFYDDDFLGIYDTYVSDTDLGELIKHDQIENIEYSKICETTEKVDRKQYPIIDYTFELSNGVHWNMDLESYEYEGRLYSSDELRELGLLNEKTRYIDKVKVSSFDEIDIADFENMIDEYGDIRIRVNLKDGTYTYTRTWVKSAIAEDNLDEMIQISDNRYCFSNVAVYKEVSIDAPSIANKFPDQLMEKDTGKIKSDTNELLTMLDGNGDEIRITYSM